MPAQTHAPRTQRAAAAARTRQVLIESGLKLAERTGLGGLSVNLVVAEAGVSKGTFFHHFPNRAAYLVALHQGFHDRLHGEVVHAIGQMPPGPARLIAGATVYLDGCLRDRGVRALLLEARAEPAITAAVQQRNDATAALCMPDFLALGWPHHRESAQLWVRLVAEAALMELASGRRLDGVRAALRDFLVHP